MDDEEAELRNPFPSPPSHYVKYTSHNLALLALLRDRTSHSWANVNQHEILADQSDVPDWPLTLLEKPRVDWILDEPDPFYDVFGDRWFVKEKIPSLAELGGNQLYPADPTIDRRPALLSVLRSLLVTFSSLISSLLAPPPSANSTTPPDWQRHTEWITVLSQNLMAAANDLRPVQARGNLESMMRHQLQLRRNETDALHAKCDALEAKLSELRHTVRNRNGEMTSFVLQNIKIRNGDLAPTDLSKTDITQNQVKPVFKDSGNTGPSITPLTSHDVLCWAEEIG